MIALEANLDNIAYDADHLAVLLEGALNSKNVEYSLNLIYKLKALGVELDFILETGAADALNSDRLQEVRRQSEFSQEDKTWVKDQLIHSKRMAPSDAFKIARSLNSWEDAYTSLK
mmetsp:Transcript_15999/g.29305  ORF Transcript_15999/g.29305 Transcript_15999/m.29305 type:complete len:116 (-) Transcript_15999:1068-1415(-)